MAAFDIEAYFRAELARLDGGSGEPQATIIQLAQLYDLAPCDGRLDWDEWQAFIGDLLCIREGVLAFEPGTVANAARDIAGAGFSSRDRISLIDKDGHGQAPQPTPFCEI